MTFDEQRQRMVDEQLKARGIADERLLEALRQVPRHLFVPEERQAEAYTDRPLVIGEGQTISQPYIVALMISRLRLQGHERVLEVGSGSGYQTALLAHLACEVFAVERLPLLLGPAQERLASLGILNVHWSAGNGSLGWPEHAPYDAIIVSAAVPEVPPPLLHQLGDQGRMILPVGAREQQMLTEVNRRGNRISQLELTSCLFVPLVGRYGW